MINVNNDVTQIMINRNLMTASNKMNRSSERLSSGLRVNRAYDDTTSMALGEKITAKVNGLKQAQRNAMNGISLIQIADSAMGDITELLDRMSELVNNSLNGTLDETNKQSIQVEIKGIIDEINNISKNTEFNKKQLLATDETINIQVGTEANNSFSLNFKNINTSSLGIDNIDVTLGNNSNVLDIINKAKKDVVDYRTDLSSIQNRLEHSYSYNGNYSESLNSNLSSLLDTDYASEMSNYTKNKVIETAGAALLAQANLGIQDVLKIVKFD